MWNFIFLSALSFAQSGVGPSVSFQAGKTVWSGIQVEGYQAAPPCPDLPVYFVLLSETNTTPVWINYLEFVNGVDEIVDRCKWYIDFREADSKSPNYASATWDECRKSPTTCNSTFLTNMVASRRASQAGPFLFVRIETESVDDEVLKVRYQTSATGDPGHYFNGSFSVDCPNPTDAGAQVVCKVTGATVEDVGHPGAVVPQSGGSSIPTPTKRRLNWKFYVGATSAVAGFGGALGLSFVIDSLPPDQIPPLLGYSDERRLKYALPWVQGSLYTTGAVGVVLAGVGLALPGWLAVTPNSVTYFSEF